MLKSGDLILCKKLFMQQIYPCKKDVADLFLTVISSYRYKDGTIVINTIESGRVWCYWDNDEYFTMLVP